MQFQSCSKNQLKLTCISLTFLLCLVYQLFKTVKFYQVTKQSKKRIQHVKNQISSVNVLNNFTDHPPHPLQRHVVRLAGAEVRPVHEPVALISVPAVPAVQHLGVASPVPVACVTTVVGSTIFTVHVIVVNVVAAELHVVVDFQRVLTCLILNLKC